MWKVFSSFAGTLSKEILSLKYKTIEDLIIGSHNADVSSQSYKNIIGDFLSFHPDGTIRKRKPVVSGSGYGMRKQQKPKDPSLRKKNLPSDEPGTSANINPSPAIYELDDSSDSDEDFEHQKWRIFISVT